MDKTQDRACVAVMTLATLGLLWCLSGCSNVTTGRKVLISAGQFHVAASKAFVDFNRTYQQSLIDKANDSATPRATAEAAINEYRAKRYYVEMAIASLEVACRTLDTALTLADNPKMTGNDLPGAIAQVLKALDEVRKALQVIGIKIGGK